MGLVRTPGTAGAIAEQRKTPQPSRAAPCPGSAGQSQWRGRLVTTTPARFPRGTQLMREDRCAHDPDRRDSMHVPWTACTWPGQVCTWPRQPRSEGQPSRLCGGSPMSDRAHTGHTSWGVPSGDQGRGASLGCWPVSRHLGPRPDHVGRLRPRRRAGGWDRDFTPEAALGAAGACPRQKQVWNEDVTVQLVKSGTTSHEGRPVPAGAAGGTQDEGTEERRRGPTLQSTATLSRHAAASAHSPFS